MYQTKLVDSTKSLEEIAALSALNLKTNLTDSEKAEQGFITWEYNLPLLQAMHAIAPSIVITYNEKVVAFALVALQETAAVHPELYIMLQNLATLQYQGKSLMDYCFYLMGQICIDKAHRGKGLFNQLYQYHRAIYGKQYEMLVTEVSTSNFRSMKAHEKTGFQTIHRYSDHMDEWNVVVWDWRQLDN